MARLRFGGPPVPIAPKVVRIGLCSVTLRSLSVHEVIRAAAAVGLESIEWGADVCRRERQSARTSGRFRVENGLASAAWRPPARPLEFAVCPGLAARRSGRRMPTAFAGLRARTIVGGGLPELRFEVT